MHLCQFKIHCDGIKISSGGTIKNVPHPLKLKHFFMKLGSSKISIVVSGTLQWTLYMLTAGILAIIEGIVIGKNRCRYKVQDLV